MRASKAVVLLSGGLDSATSAAHAIADGYELIALSLHYGQRHDRELIAAKRVAEYLGINEHYVVNVNLAQWGGSALTDQAVDVPTDGVKPGVIPITYMPGRNTVFLAKDEPCGLCDSCRIRDRALIDAGRPDLATLVGQELYEQENRCATPVS